MSDTQTKGCICRWDYPSSAKQTLIRNPQCPYHGKMFSPKQVVTVNRG